MKRFSYHRTPFFPLGRKLNYRLVEKMLPLDRRTRNGFVFARQFRNAMHRRVFHMAVCHEFYRNAP